MNRRRRRLARARRKRARIIRELRAWSKCNYVNPPKGGRLRVPVLALRGRLSLSMRDAFAPLLAAVRAWGGPRRV